MHDENRWHWPGKAFEAIAPVYARGGFAAPPRDRDPAA